MLCCYENVLDGNTRMIPEKLDLDRTIFWRGKDAARKNSLGP